MTTKKLYIAAFVFLAMAGCRGMESSNPPIHPNLNMDYQERFNAQDVNPFFADNRSMRTPPAGTVARGRLREDTEFYAGRLATGAFVETAPVEVTHQLLLRGQDRYNIYCAPCHSPVGDGQGIIFQYGWAPAPSFHDQRLIDAPDGFFFDVITNGIRTMQPYRHQLNEQDRWAVISYIRALQRSQRATEEDVPREVLPTIAATN